MTFFPLPWYIDPMKGLLALVSLFERMFFLMSSTYSDLQYGSRGADVTRLQNALISLGYSVGSAGADGIFGGNTDAALRAYQRDKGLSVDGIAGQNTLSALYDSVSGTASDRHLSGVSQKTAAALSDYGPGYSPSEAVTAAKDYLDSLRNSKPEGYKSGYESQLEDIYNKIMNQPDFSYDMSSDPLFRQYITNYVNQGRLAMEDSMGQTAALTGGYGSSYSQTAGQQIYNRYLQQISSIVPELYARARSSYDTDLNRLYDLYNMTASLDSQDYSRYRDSVSDYYSDLSSASSAYNTAAETDYSRWLNMMNYYLSLAKLENSDYWTEKDYELSLDQLNRQKSNTSTGSSGRSSTGATENTSEKYEGWLTLLKKTTNTLNYNVTLNSIKRDAGNGLLTEKQSSSLLKILETRYNKTKAAGKTVDGGVFWFKNM